MEITPLLKAEIEAVMKDYWDSYFRGDYDRWASYLPDHYKNIGTTTEEIWYSKQEIVDYTLRLSEQLIGQAEMRNKTVDVISYDPYVMAHEIGDVYVKAEEGWMFYAELRLSSLLAKDDDGWKILHQHGSFPDSKADEGEAFGVNELKIENKKLKDAILSRTKELEEKNRSLEIEAALERVRAVSMGMQTASELQKVSEIIFTELKALGFANLRNTEIIVNRNDKEIITSYYYSDYGVSGVIDVDYNTNPIVKKWAQDIQKADDAFSEVIIPEDELKSWSTYRLSLGYVPDPKLETATSIYYYSYSTGLGALSISSFEPIKSNEIRILEHFRNVFKLAYQRYHDIALAEAQAREAKIEAALEKVRSRSLAMHSSEELGEVITTVVEQLKALDFSVEDGVALITHVDDSRDLIEWMENPGFPSALKFILPYFDHPVLIDLWEAKEKGKKFLATRYTAEQNKTFLNHIYKHTDFRHTPQEIKDYSLSAETYGYSIAFQKHTAIFINDYSSYSLSDDEIDVLLHFSRVFEQAYIRFLDLQKAEAQAREAKIEGALERVRAKAIAMQKSEDLSEVAVVLFNEFSSFNGRVGTCGFVLCDKYPDEDEYWVCWETGVQPPMRMPHTTDPICKYLHKGWEKKKGYSEIEKDGQELAAHFDYLLTVPSTKPIIENWKKQQGSFPEYQKYHAAYFNHGFVFVIALDPSVEVYIDLLKRFAKVFQQAYNRFLDLQKAEFQSREAQIEASVERVRSAALSMHSSADFGLVNEVLWREVNNLKVKGFAGAGIALFDVEEHITWWDFSSAGNIGKHEQRLTRYNYKKFPLLGIEIWEAYQKHESYFVLEYNLERLKQGAKEWAQINPVIAEDFNKALDSGQFTYQWGACARITDGFLTFDHLESPDKDAKNILLKMAAAFDLAYQRYLDLQKAEAQVREAKIEAALEKIRSRSMAMHSSNELLDVIKIVSQQIFELGIKFSHVSFGINNQKQDFQFWTSMVGSPDPVKIHVPAMDSPIHQNIKSAQTEGVDFFTDFLTAKENDAWTAHLKKHAEVPFLTTEQIAFIKGKDINRSIVLLSKIFLVLAKYSEEPFTEEENGIIKRIAGVFEQTYTRFLDLQIAESQARQAQIEASLERIRAQSMAMHKTKELQKVIHSVHSELLKLDVPIMGGSFVVINEEINVELYAWGAGGTADTVRRTHIPHFDLPFCTNLIKGIKNGPGFFTEEFTQAEKKTYFTELFKVSPWSELDEEEKRKTLDTPGSYTRSVAVGPLTSLVIINYYGHVFTEEENSILRRIQKTFEQSYTRFLDLQKAEQQTKRISAINRENERLLHSILPEKIAEQIRKGQQRVVKRFEEVSILFADIVGFTVLSDKLSPDKVVDILNGLFSSFDDLTDKYSLEKIKTIGDAYMVAAGVPNVNANHAHTMFKFAQEMLIALQEFNQQNDIDLNLRIGISSGPVVAGVIGKKKFAYDLWGDTVNTAARMEAYGKEGRIQVSPTCFEILKADYNFEKISNVPIKGKGMMDVYVW